MKIFSAKYNNSSIITGIRLNKSETKKLLNPTKEDKETRNLILKKAENTIVGKKELGNGIIEIHFKK